MSEKPEVFDLVKLAPSKSSEGAVLTLVNPVNNTPIEGVTITLMGADSKEYQALRRKLQNARLRNVTSRGKMRVTSEEIEDEALQLIVAATKGWTGVVIEGVEQPFTMENAKSLFTRFPWIREQVDEFINDRANFLGNSSKTS